MTEPEDVGLEENVWSIKKNNSLLKTFRQPRNLNSEKFFAVLFNEIEKGYLFNGSEKIELTVHCFEPRQY